jgi:hypothetical protein
MKMAKRKPTPTLDVAKLTFDNTKYIVSQWVICDKKTQKLWGYQTEQRVVMSTHPRYPVGSRFDNGFGHLAIKEGYSLIQLPHPPLPKDEDE